MSNEVKPDLDRLVSVYIKIRDKKLELQAALKEQEEELVLKMKAIELKLLEHCKDNSVESVRTENGTFYRSTRSKYWTSDWEAMNKFILENEAPELLEKRIHQGNMKQFLEDNPEKLPQGLNCESEYTVTVRRKK
jgi:hypothetical protein